MRIFVKIRIGDEHEVITEVTSSIGEISGPNVAVASGFVAVMSPFANCMMTDFGDALAGGTLRRYGAYANRVRKGLSSCDGYRHRGDSPTCTHARPRGAASC